MTRSDYKKGKIGKQDSLGIFPLLKKITMDFTGKVVLITGSLICRLIIFPFHNLIFPGSSSGTGEQIAYQFARLGAHVVITGREPDRVRQVGRRCRALILNRNARVSRK